jgi:K+ transporter
MARRRGGGGKTKEEAKVERLTWLAMAGVFILLSFVDSENLLPDYMIAVTISLILFASGIYQFMQVRDNQRWRVSPFTYIVATGLMLLAIYEGVAMNRNWFSFPLDLRLISLGATVFIIALGVITNEQ